MITQYLSIMVGILHLHPHRHPHRSTIPRGGTCEGTAESGYLVVRTMDLIAVVPDHFKVTPLPFQGLQEYWSARLLPAHTAHTHQACTHTAHTHAYPAPPFFMHHPTLYTTNGLTRNTVGGNNNNENQNIGCIKHFYTTM